jgi:hypothetical protein
MSLRSCRRAQRLRDRFFGCRRRLDYGDGKSRRTGSLHRPTCPKHSNFAVEHEGTSLRQHSCDGHDCGHARGRGGRKEARRLFLGDDSVDGLRRTCGAMQCRLCVSPDAATSVCFWASGWQHPITNGWFVVNQCRLTSNAALRFAVTKIKFGSRNRKLAMRSCGRGVYHRGEAEYSCSLPLGFGIRLELSR